MRIFKIIQRNRNTIINVYVTFLRAGRARGALSGKKMAPLKELIITLRTRFLPEVTLSNVFHTFFINHYV